MPLYILRRNSLLIIFTVLFLLTPTKTFANKIIFIPLDNRPVSLDYVVDIVQSSDIKIITPPEELISTHESDGKVDELWQWLLKNARNAQSAVISTDTLIYGGLVPSRTHHLSSEVIKSRINRLKELKDKFPQLKIYCFSSLLRTPRQSFGNVEPHYYKEYGPYFFRLGELLDKQEVYGYNNLDQIEIKNIIEILPEEHYKDWFERREKNYQANLQLADLTRKRFFHYYAIGKDDNAPLSQTHIETRKLLEETQDISSARFQIIPGIDQISILLLVRAINEHTWTQPYVYPFYADGAGARTVPLYSDQTVGESVSAQIFASGALPTLNPESADLILVLNTPFDGITLEATHPQNLSFISNRERKLANDIENLLKEGKPLALADVAYANGADNGFMKELYQREMFYSITSYAGWNTADNSIGSALAQGLLMKNHSSQKQKNFLQVRLLDDWYYQANVKVNLKENSLAENIDIYQLGKQQDKVEKWLIYYMNEFNLEHKDLNIKKYSVHLPWSRLFEVYVEIK